MTNGHNGNIIIKVTDGHKEGECMKKFGEFICKHKKIILIIALILIIPSIIGMKATRINYDILVYLPDDIETLKGQEILANDFDMGAFSVVVLD